MGTSTSIKTMNPQMQQHMQYMQQQQQFQYLCSQQMPQNTWFAQYYQGLQQQQLQQFAAWFTAIDTDRNGTLDAQELTRIQFAGKSITINTAVVLIKAFDKDSSGNISFWEYTALHLFIMRLQQSFVAADSDRSGTIGWHEIQTALAHAGFTLEPAAVQMLMAKFGAPGAGGQMTFEGYLAMAAHLAHLKSV